MHSITKSSCTDSIHHLCKSELIILINALTVTLYLFEQSDRKNVSLINAIFVCIQFYREVS